MGRFKSEYQLRCAAGQYYLLNMAQKGIPYERPIMVNSMGAEMWQELVQGKTAEQIAEYLGKKYEVATEAIKTDILRFCEQLKEQGVLKEVQTR